MKYNPEIHHRRSIRLEGYDYSQVRAYFVTICTQNRIGVFGDIVAGEMVLNDAGRIIQTVWDEMTEHYFGIAMDLFQIMPNHVHGIIVLTHPVSAGAGPRACPHQQQPELSHHIGQPQGVAPTLSLPDAVHRFKSLTTTRYRCGVKQHDWPPFPGRLWQRNYYERIIRNDGELNRIREYIINNPAKWEMDRGNPNGAPPMTTNVGACLPESRVGADLCVCPHPESQQEHP